MTRRTTSVKKIKNYDDERERLQNMLDSLKEKEDVQNDSIDRHIGSVVRKVFVDENKKSLFITDRNTLWTKAELKTFFDDLYKLYVNDKQNEEKISLDEVTSFDELNVDEKSL